MIVRGKMFLRLIGLSVIGLVLFISGACDKYISYDYSAGSIGSRIEISGFVTNIFTGDVIKGAWIEFGQQRTYSDSTGQYHIEYILGIDEQRDKPVLLTINAEDYLPFEKSFILYPVDTVINLRMEYGAPIIEKIWIGSYNDLIIFQSRIHDYQSVDNIREVISEMHYYKNGESYSRVLRKAMDQISPEENDTAIYQSVGPITLGDGWFLELREFLIAAHDWDGYMDEVRNINDDNWSPDTLFTPIPLL